MRNTNGWLPQANTNKDNTVTDYLRRVLLLPREQVLILAEKIWVQISDVKGHLFFSGDIAGTELLLISTVKKFRSVLL